MKESTNEPKWIFLFLTAAYPIVLLSIRGGMSVCFVALFATSICYLAQFGWHKVYDSCRRSDIAFSITLASPALATFISEASHNGLELKTFDGPSRFLLSVPIYFAAKHISFSIVPALECGIPLGALAGLLTFIFFPSASWPGQATYFADPTAFGGAMLVLGFLSFSSINWSQKGHTWILALKWLALAIGIDGAIASGERGVWLAAPVIAIIFFHRKIALKRGITIITIAALCGLFSYWMVPKVHERVDRTRTELSNVLSGNLDTSIGIRLQIWRAALEIAKKNPIIGIGEKGVPDEMRSFAEKGQLTSEALTQALAQIHNEIIANVLRHGIFGLIASAAIYVIPMFLFFHFASNKDRIRSRAARMGMIFVSAYAIFGLTVETFNLKMVATFYAVSIALLLAIVRNNEQKIDTGNGY